MIGRKVSLFKEAPPTRAPSTSGAPRMAAALAGETLVEREQGRTEEVNARQLTAGLKGLSRDDLARITLAYEPVWAIGTGRTATPQQAAEVHAYLRGVVSGLFDQAAAGALRIQYGGSVKPDNTAALLASPDVNGALVGGASLEAATFLGIVRYR